MEPSPHQRDPMRPQPVRPITETIGAWLQWFGVVRLLVVALAVAGVGAGAFWLLRAPATAIEDTLPIASRSSTSTVADAASRPSSDPAGNAAPGSTGGDATSTSLVTMEPAADVVVDVAGAVAVPGVYQLPAGSRVHHAIEAAGGLSVDADAETLNLAAPLRDGDRLYVPHVGVPVPSVVAPSGGAAGPEVTPGEPTSSAPSGPLDLNRASAEALDALPGVGPSTAAAIVAFREQNGPYASIDDLLEVRGIGPAKLEAIRAFVTV